MYTCLHCTVYAFYLSLFFAALKSEHSFSFVPFAIFSHILHVSRHIILNRPKQAITKVALFCRAESDVQ